MFDIKITLVFYNTTTHQSNYKHNTDTYDINVWMSHCFLSHEGKRDRYLEQNPGQKSHTSDLDSHIRKCHPSVIVSSKTCIMQSHCIVLEIVLLVFKSLYGLRICTKLNSPMFFSWPRSATILKLADRGGNWHGLSCCRTIQLKVQHVYSEMLLSSPQL